MTTNYQEVQKRLAQGWNTWNTRSVLSHVLLPEGIAFNLGLKDPASRAYLKEALIGRHGENDEVVLPGQHAYDGSYTHLTLRWKGMEIDVESAAQGDSWVLRVTPRDPFPAAAELVLEGGLLWNRPGWVWRTEDGLEAQTAGRVVRVYCTQPAIEDVYIPAQSAYYVLLLKGAVGFSSGQPRSLEEIGAVLDGQRGAHQASLQAYGDLSEVYEALQTCLAWDTIYEAEHDRVVSPVSRIWNVTWGGFVLFDWDTYFAAYMLSLGSKDLAYANAVEITREQTEAGFIPNFGSAAGIKSRDRSQPPVGSLIIRELYRKFGERWLLEEVFDALLRWNRWWPEHRAWHGLLAWGSEPYSPQKNADLEINSIDTWQGAAWESGLDNSPMYDGIPFDPQSHCMLLADVGLMALYVADCSALAEIAQVLGREREAAELQARARQFDTALKGLWDEQTGLFLNQRLDTAELTRRLSPTHFYPLLSRTASPHQAERMVREHLYNPQEFWGEWVLPSIARSDPAFADQDYWRGRVWGPMNFLVYLGLCNYDQEQARRDLAQRSQRLFLKNWRESGFVCENYSAITGLGGEISNSDRYYHWGGLLGMIALIEAGYMPRPLE